jgi:hypothetical protein
MLMNSINRPPKEKLNQRQKLRKLHQLKRLSQVSLLSKKPCLKPRHTRFCLTGLKRAQRPFLKSYE